MAESKKITPQDIESASVRLGNFLGMKPETWLPGAFLAALVLALAAALTLPGVLRYGTLLSVRSKPSGSAVTIDGVHAGTTPGTFFVPAGSRTVTVSRPGFPDRTTELAVKGRLLGSLVFPRRQVLELSLSSGDPEKPLSEAFPRHASAGLAGTPSAIYQLDPALPDTLLALAETGEAASIDRRSVGSLAASALAAAGSAASLRDASRAVFLAAAAGAPSPLGLVAGLETIGAVVSGKPASQRIPANLVPESLRQAIRSSPAVARLEARASTGTTPGETASGLVSFASHSFHTFPPRTVQVSGEAPGGFAVPYAVDLPFFGLARTEVTNEQWARFVAANPEWAAETGASRDSPSSSGLRQPADSADPGSYPVTGVSWDAARAYCEWLGSFAPDGYSVRLPSEAMWEAAFEAGGAAWKTGAFNRGGADGPVPVHLSGTDGSGISGLAGNVWEWCDDHYYPYPALVHGFEPFPTGERSVRGGSWANPADSLKPESRGGFGSGFSSPFLGFRPAIVKR